MTKRKQPVGKVVVLTSGELWKPDELIKKYPMFEKIGLPENLNVNICECREHILDLSDAAIELKDDLNILKTVLEEKKVGLALYSGSNKRITIDDAFNRISSDIYKITEKRLDYDKCCGILSDERYEELLTKAASVEIKCKKC